MNTFKISVKDKVAILTLDRGKANAINAEMAAELTDMFNNIQADSSAGGLIITGKEDFFSAGLDLIELFDYNENQIKEFWQTFLNLVKTATSFSKPMVAAINGHSPAGGCVLALCCDYRLMAEGKYIIGLNEVPVGIIVPDSIFNLYAFWIGKSLAYQFLLEGKLMGTGEALKYKLVDEVVNKASILTLAERQVRKYLQFNWTTWQQSKLNMRGELIQSTSKDQTEILDAILKQWWSPYSRSIMQTIINNLKKS
ncbi:MAG TPA: enoyl-CoA hydratase/isomerase family protein [Sphingobacteriaceae bacterium]